MPVCCWQRPRLLGSRGRVTPLLSPSWSARCRRLGTWWAWMQSLSRSIRWVYINTVYLHPLILGLAACIQILKTSHYLSPGRGRAAQWRHQVNHQAQSDVCSQDHLCARSGAQRGGSLHRRLHLHSGAGGRLQSEFKKILFRVAYFV